jgi:hypothetical protein
MRKLILLVGLLLPALSQAQSYSINWFKIAGGGGSSTNGQYALSGTVGQQDASGPMTGGTYSLTGGYWSRVAAVQTPGAPILSIALGCQSAIVSWPSPSTGYLLQSNGGLSTTNWSYFTGLIVTNAAGTTNSVTITPPAGNCFFRLIKPAP